MEESKKSVLSKIINGVLYVVLGFLIFCLGSIVITSKKASNYGVPSILGNSFLYVWTDSLGTDQVISSYSDEDWEEMEEAIKKYEEGDVSQPYFKISEYKKLISWRIEEERVGSSFKLGHIEKEWGLVLKKDKIETIMVGDVISFYYERISFLDTHRVMEVVIKSDEIKYVTGYGLPEEKSFLELKEGDFYRDIDDNAIYKKTDDNYIVVNDFSFPNEGEVTLFTRGDNLHASLYENAGVDVSYRDDPVTKENYVGKVHSGSKAFGTFLTCISPSAGNPERATLISLLIIIIPLGGITISTVIKVTKEARERKKKDEAELAKALKESGIDENDEKAVYLFTQKWIIKRNIQEEMEENKAKYKKELEKETREKVRLYKEYLASIENDPLIKDEFEKANINKNDPLEVIKWKDKRDLKEKLRQEYLESLSKKDEIEGN